MSVNFDPAIEFYDATRGFPAGEEASIGALFARAGSFTPQTRALEIGIGTGRIALPTAPHTAAYYGIDLSRGMLGKLHSKRRGEPVYIAQADATRLPFADAAFDVVIGVHVFHLISGWQNAVREIWRVLKPGGLLLHGWNHRLANHQLEQVWEAAVDVSSDVGLSYSRGETLDAFLTQHGWEKQGDELHHAFTILRSPAQYVDDMQGRRWSRCWRMTDQQIARGVAALQAFIAQTYPDPSQPEHLQSSFHIQAYAADKIEAAR